MLQTRALPLGYRAIRYSVFLSENDSDGNRTRVTAVKGRCLNRLTTEPYMRPCWPFFRLASKSVPADISIAPPVGLEPTTLRLTAACSTD